jgi:hypothetical protein
LVKTARACLLVLSACVAVLSGARPAGADVAFDWAEIGVKALAKVQVAARFRADTLSRLAVFNALNAIEQRYRFYGPALDPEPEAARDVAAATAAWVVLGSELGSDRALLDDAYREALRKTADGAAKNLGIALGKRAAYAVILMRVNDVYPEFKSDRQPAAGVYELTPEYKPETSGPSIVGSPPMAVKSVDAYDPGPPPAVGSALARRDIVDVKAVGARESITRTADQTAAAAFWAAYRDEDQLAFYKSIAEGCKLTQLESARMLAQIGLAVFDAAMISTTLKRKYYYWRPYNAIRGRFADARDRDDKWEPLRTTPPNSDYPSGDAHLAGLQLEILNTVNAGCGAPLKFHNSSLRQDRTWSTAEAMAAEWSSSRVWNGVHFRNSVETGLRLGQRVMRDIIRTQLTPLPQR